MAAVTTPTPTQTPRLSSLAAALHSGDRTALARTFAELSEEALILCESAPSEQLWSFWLRLSETFQYQGRAASEPAPKPKRRWFR